jgi:Asp-tRNA(Asn)/Glu-tRNA(Gln) amidotransferase A subunit family amidase
MTEPCDLSAVEARRLIGRKRLSPIELLESCIARIEMVNAAVNAVVATCYDRAREEARAATDAVMRGDELGPLHGLPLGVKDLNDTGGLVTTYGSPIYKDNVPDKDETLVATLRQAGAIVVGKTNTPEFGAGANTKNPVYGATVNPFDTARICGGSSGGSAVALATGMLPLCTGSDSGGSLRIPAGFCGVVAHRSTPGLVPTERHSLGYTTFGVQGPMARTVEDTAYMLSVNARYDTRDPLSAAVDSAQFETVPPVDLSKLRVAVSEDLGFAIVDERIRKTFRERVDLFGSVFKECVTRSPELDTVRRTNHVLRALHFLARHRDHYENQRDVLGPNVIANYEMALKLDAAEITWALQQQTTLFRNMAALFEEVDILICPTVSVPPFPVEQLYCDEVDGVKLETYFEWLSLTWGLTIPGNPVTALPCGLDPTGTPFGLQICGPYYEDRFVLGVAKSLEALFAGNPVLARPEPDLRTLTA